MDMVSKNLLHFRTSLHSPQAARASRPNHLDAMPGISNTSTLVTLFQADDLMTCLQGDMHNATKMQRKCKDAKKHVELG